METKEGNLITAVNALRTSLSEELGEGEGFVETFRAFRKSMTLYGCAIREIRTKFEVLNDELALTGSRNPIKNIYSRVKSPESIFGKMKRKGIPFTIENMEMVLNDIAGVRVVCQYIDDIYTVAAMLGGQDDIAVVSIKDYIKNPKPNGYRSFHMIVEVPVFFSEEKNIVRVEVQIRTIAMDFWATLEHGLKYKHQIANEKEIVEELKYCSEKAYDLDVRMQSLKDQIYGKNHSLEKQ